MSPVVVETSQDVDGDAGSRTFEIKLADFGVGGYGLNIIGNPGAAAKDDKDLGLISDALVKGYTDGCSNKAQAIDLFTKRFPDKDPNYVSKSWEKVCELIGNNPGDQSAEGWQETLDLYRELGVLRQNTTPTDILGN